MPDPTPPDALLAHAGFLRALARGLLADEAEAEDLVQETWLRALQSGPSRPEAWPAWLRTVTRNLAFKRLRGRARQRAREEDSARNEALPSALDQVTRDESLAGVVGAVLELPEHYREVVMLRFLEGLAPRHIAAQLGLPVGTIRMRLHRALKQLREKLDSEHDGDRSRWRRSLALLVGAPRPAAAPVAALIPLFVLAAVVLVAGWLLVRRPWTDAAPPVPAFAPDSALGDLDREPEATSAPALERLRDVAAPPSTPPTVADAQAPARLTLDVRVVDAAGAPVVGAEVLASNDRGDLEPRGRSGAGGHTRLSFPPRREPGRVLVAARGAGHAPSLVVAAELIADPATEPSTEPEPTVLVVRGDEARVSGAIVDAAGRPLADARVVVGEEFRLGLGQLGPRRRAVRQVGRLFLGHAPGSSGEPAFQLERELAGFLGAQVLASGGRHGRLPGVGAARADARGRFMLRGLEPGRARIRIEAPGHAAFESTLEISAGDLALGTIVLERAAALVGRVGRADGLPHAGGVVYAWREGTPTGVAARFRADGAFRLEGLAPGPTRVFAETLSGDSLPELSTHALLDLAPGETTRWDARVDDVARISGRLVDEEGRPLADWRVELRLDRLPSGTVAATRSGADGAFTIPACPPLPGRLALFHPGGEPLLPSFVVADVHAGTSLGSVTVPAVARALAVVRGRVLDAHGAPLGETQLLLVPRSCDAAHPVRTDGTGNFATSPLPGGIYELFVPELPPGTRAGEALRLGPGGDVEVGSLRLPAAGRLVLETPEGDDRVVRLRLSRVRAAGAPLVVFEGPADLPTEVELGAGEWTVGFPGSGRADVPLRLAPGARTLLTVPAR